MQVTKEEFLEWRSQYVTKQFMEAIKRRIEDAKDILSVNAGVEPVDDRLLVGMIRAFSDVLDVQAED